MSEQIIIEGDCLQVMRGFADKSFDLCLTDPPYGIKADSGVGGFGSSDTSKHYKDDWDAYTPPREVFDEILRVSKSVVIFGGQFFTDKLPPNGHWIVWDKKGGISFDNPFGDCELAWTNINRKSVKKYTCIQQGFVAEERDRWHPTQKPVKLFGEIIRDYTEEGATILDPFAGSGTTGLAAKYLNRPYTLIEISPKYIEIARKRLSQDMLF